MRKVILYIAMSLDGYIADDAGGVDWLSAQPDGEDPDSYPEFIRNIDTVLMGFRTYHQIVTELSPDAWVYDDLTSYVLTHRTLPSSENIIFTEKNPDTLLSGLKAQPGKDIWICGGSKIVSQCVLADCIDEYYISILPVILGSGIPLFQKGLPTRHLKLLETKSRNGITKVRYARR